MNTNPQNPSSTLSATHPERIVITGSSGYCGRAIVAAVRKQWPNCEILGIDVVAPNDNPPDVFSSCDISSTEVDREFERFRPDSVIHLAFVVNPIRDRRRMRQINIDGTRRILSASAACGVSRIVIGSSATSYGAMADNPIPLTESMPVRAGAEYQYAAEKCEVEKLVEEFRAANPQITTATTRPCMIYGPGLSNYLTKFILNGPVIVLPDGNNTPMQFVHLDDVAEATCRILASGVSGPFNIAPPDWFTLRDLASMSGRICIPAPLKGCLAFTFCWWALRLPLYHFPPGLWYFIRYPWVVSPDRLCSELGFQFRRSSGDVIRMLLKDARQLREKPSSSAK
jgi:UDP-glucose 4-epimerase